MFRFCCRVTACAVMAIVACTPCSARSADLVADPTAARAHEALAELDFGVARRLPPGDPPGRAPVNPARGAVTFAATTIDHVPTPGAAAVGISVLAAMVGRRRRV